LAQFHNRPHKTAVVFVLLAGLALVTLGFRKAPRPARPVTLADPAAPLRDTNLQALIDDADDGGVVRIPRGRYVLKKGILVKARNNLTIRCEKGAQIFVDDVNEDIISFDECRNVRLETAYLRHLKPLREYACHGDVVAVSGSEKAAIVNCELNGCGAIGLDARNSKELTVRNCYVHHNTFNAFCLSDCKKVRIQSCVIEDNANFLQAHNLDDVELSDNVIRRNGGYWRKKDAKPGLKIEGGKGK